MSQTGPLSGVRVLDLSRVLAGPFCTLVLAELGAAVIKVEPPGGDDARSFGPWVDGKSAYFASLNRGKRSIRLDLKQPGDRALFRRLLAKSDVLVENFRPGAMARLGLGWEELRAGHPGLVYCALSGFGQTGPKAGLAAYDLVIQAMGGIMSLTGQPGGPPTRVGTSIGDIAAGLFAATGVVSALYQRQQTGRGTLVDVAMLDCQVAILENALARLFASGQTPGPLGCRHPSITPFDAFRCADGWVVVCAGNDRLFAELCRVLGRPELAREPRFAGNEQRTRHQAELKRELEGLLAARGCGQWLEELGRAGVPSGPLQDLAQVAADPQVLARNMVVRAGGLAMAGNPVKLEGAPDPPEREPAPELDADRRAVLAELEEP
jgi:CoA:oxalate CoA-transferase